MKEFEGYTLAQSFRDSSVQNTIIEEHRLEKLEEIQNQEYKYGER